MRNCTFCVAVLNAIIGMIILILQIITLVTCHDVIDWIGSGIWCGCFSIFASCLAMQNSKSLYYMPLRAFFCGLATIILYGLNLNTVQLGLENYWRYVSDIALIISGSLAIVFCPIVAILYRYNSEDAVPNQQSAEEEIITTGKKTDFISDELIYCSICFDEFDEEIRKPKRLPCNHIVCLFCLTELHRLSDEEFSCPFCRRRFDQRNLDQLPDNLMHLHQTELSADYHLVNNLRASRSETDESTLLSGSWGLSCQPHLECQSPDHFPNQTTVNNTAINFDPFVVSASNSVNGREGIYYLIS